MASELKVRNEKLSDVELHRRIAEMVWCGPGDEKIDIEEVLEYHLSIPHYKNYAKEMTRAKRNGDIMVAASIGVPTFDEQLEHFQYLESAGADSFHMPVDTYSRMGQWEIERNCYEEGLRINRPLLNGWAIGIHGVAGTRRLFEAINKPLCPTCVSGNANFAQLACIAGGGTSSFGAALAGAITNDANVALVDAIYSWQPVARLIGWLEERGAPFSWGIGPPGCGTITAPSLQIASNISQVLMDAEQGIKNVSLYSHVNCCLLQDLATIRMERKLCQRYLERFGYDVDITQVVVHWLGPFPKSPWAGSSRISLDTLSAMWGGVQRIRVQSTEQGVGIPTKEANAQAIEVTKQVLNYMKNQPFPESPELQLEEQMIEMEVVSLMERMLELGNNDPISGTLKAFETGAWETPYCTSAVISDDKVLLMRDAHGAVRFLTTGNLPFHKEIVDFHKDRIQQRVTQTGRKEHELLIDDLVCREIFS